MPQHSRNRFLSLIHRRSNIQNQPEPLLLLSQRHLPHHMQSMQQTICRPDVTTLKQRFKNHRFDIHNDRDTPVARHFNLLQHSLNDVNIIAIDCLPTADNISILNKETHWIHTLKTSEPQGINVKEQSSFPISILHT